MNIQRLASGRYRVLVRRTINGQQVTKSGTFDTKPEAQAWGANQELTLATSGLTMAQAIDQYAEEHLEPQLKAKTTETGIQSHRKLMSRMETIKTRLAAYTLESFTPMEAKRYRDLRLQSVAPETVRKELYWISGMYRWFIKEQIMTDLVNPIRHVELPSPGPGRDVVHAPSDQQRLRMALKPEYALIYRLLLESAMRLSEVIYLRAEWCTNDLTKIRLPQDITKAKKPRVVPLTTQASEVLREALGGRTEGRVFNVKYDTFRQNFDRTKKRLGLDHLRLHDCRHTAISYFADHNMGTTKLMQISGHNSMQMVKRYVHHDEDNTREEMNRIRGSSGTEIG